MTSGTGRNLVLTLVACVGLMACQPGSNPFAPKDKPAEDAAVDASAAPATSVRLVDRDVEAPEVFQVTDEALWDGRPSLGGVWVASPDAVNPERVILRNPGNGKFVIGALFRRERDNPGPKLQISSDAASALGLLAGQPGKLNVTALRREEAPAVEPDASKPILDAAETVETTSLDAVAVAGAALDEVDATTPPVAAAPAAVEQPAPPAASGTQHTLQIGIFSVEANAKRAADALKKAGVAFDIRPGTTQGKAFWSVVAKGSGDKAALLAKVKGLGFTDAYFTR
ncbi:SPOR domain-containing protein [Rhodobacter ferrooxidans]|uniref:Sporulation domain protein n=1 Tax=Rhodobacter ferrooxidans TaxID=371731 RepID=C8S0H0_9RHOB|nr:SPOR domain-containing protein [Rhodobacter sp. SW2]EEW25504.1 Sporulation domain protein [Rhodobacter sp. SW2]